MIKELEIKNFKCFTDFKVDFSKMTIFSGANAVGKSTVVQALLLFSHGCKSTGNGVNITNAFGRKIGNPADLISFDSPKKLEGADFQFKALSDTKETVLKFLVDRDSYNNKLSCNSSDDNVLENLFYLNAERLGPRMEYHSNADDIIESDGSNAPFLLVEGDMSKRKTNALFCPDNRNMKFSELAGFWMGLILDDESLTLNTDYDLNVVITIVQYGRKGSQINVIPPMTGFGISYVLPVVTAALWCSSIENSVLVIENPEAHLHPFSQSQLGRFLMIVACAGVQVIVETHSEHIIDGARIQAAQLGESESLLINFLSARNDQTKPGVRTIVNEKITVDKNGNLSKWPKGFYDQKKNDLRDLFGLSRKSIEDDSK